MNMSCRCAGVLGVAAMLLWPCVTVSMAGEVQQEPELPAAIIEALQKAPVGFQRLAQDLIGKSREVLSHRIPDELKDGARKWSEKIVRSTWLPPDVTRVFKGQQVRSKAYRPSNVDYLRADYTLAGARFSLLETRHRLGMLWNNPNIQIGKDPAKTAIFLSLALLRIPDERAFDIEATMQKWQGCYLGKLRIEKAEDEEHPWWYHDMTVLLVPEFFYIFVGKRDGRFVDGDSRGGSPPRFKDEKQLTIVMKPERESVEYGGLIPVKMILRNNAGSPLMATAYHFRPFGALFSARSATGGAKASKKPQPASGRQSRIRIAARSEHAMTLYLNKFLDFREPGEFQVLYRVTVEYWQVDESLDTVGMLSEGLGSMRIRLLKADD